MADETINNPFYGGSRSGLLAAHTSTVWFAGSASTRGVQLAPGQDVLAPCYGVGDKIDGAAVGEGRGRGGEGARRVICGRSATPADTTALRQGFLCGASQAFVCERLSARVLGPQALVDGASLGATHRPEWLDDGLSRTLREHVLHHVSVEVLLSNERLRYELGDLWGASLARAVPFFGPDAWATSVRLTMEEGFSNDTFVPIDDAPIVVPVRLRLTGKTVPSHLVENALREAAEAPRRGDSLDEFARVALNLGRAAREAVLRAAGHDDADLALALEDLEQWIDRRNMP